MSQKMRFVQVNQHPFVGSMQDNLARQEGQSFGPLIQRVMIDQFHRSLFGAKGKWWEFDNDVGSFKDEILATTFADVIRANTKAEVPDNVFLLKGSTKAKGSDSGFRPINRKG
jgi:hypothetical protein